MLPDVKSVWPVIVGRDLDRKSYAIANVLNKRVAGPQSRLPGTSPSSSAPDKLYGREVLIYSYAPRFNVSANRTSTPIGMLRYSDLSIVPGNREIKMWQCGNPRFRHVPNESRTPSVREGRQPLAEPSAPNIAANGSHESAFYARSSLPRSPRKRAEGLPNDEL